MVCLCPKERHCTGEGAISFSERPRCDVLPAATKAQPAVAQHLQALFWLSVWRRRNTQACRVFASCGACCSRPMPSERKLLRRKAPLLQCKTAVRRASCGLQTTAGYRVARASVPLWSLSLGRRCSTQAFRAHAPCRAWSGLSVRYKRPLRYRQASLLRCKTVVRRASCGLQTTAGCRVVRASA